MQITFNILLSYLTNYLLTSTVAFIGSTVKELGSAMKTKSKLNKTKIILSAVIGGFISCAIYRFLSSHMNKTIEFELYMAISFGIGLISPYLLEIISTKNIMKKVTQGVIEKCGGDTGKAIVNSWKEADQEAEAKREESKKKAKGKNSKASDAGAKKKTTRSGN